MKQLRADAQIDRHLHLEPEEERRRRPGGGDSTLSAVDASAYANRRVSSLASDEREQVADQALNSASGSLPYRAEMEDWFGQSFADVRVASGDDTREALQDVGASGVARDQSIAFRESDPAREVVAHELTHVVQAQGGGSGSVAAAEREAHGAEAQLAMGGPVQATPGVGSAGVAHFRDDDDDIFAGYRDLADSGAFGFPMKDPWEKADEKEVDWRPYVNPHEPSDPFDKFMIENKSHTPKAPAEPKVSRPRNEHPSHHRREPTIDLEGESVMDGFRRDEYWGAFTAATKEAQTTHNGLAHSVESFRHAERDEQLEALGFILPNGKWQGDMAALTDKQSVPKQGGSTVGGLFNDSNDLKLTKHDNQAINSSTKTTKGGRGKVEDSMLGTSKADNGLTGAISSVREKTDLVLAEQSGVTAAMADLDAENASNEAGEIETEIEGLKQQMKNIKDGVAGVFAVVTAALHFANGDVGDGVDQIGVLAGLVLDHIDHPDLANAENRLSIAKHKVTTARGIAFKSRIEQSTARLRASLSALNTAKSQLLQALTTRRQAYNALGTAAGNAIDCPESSKHKISAILAAIPLVEMVIARARHISGSAPSPEYSVKAGKGFGMANYHGYEVVSDFIGGVSEIDYCRNYYTGVELLWAERLAQLLAVKEKIGGPRPGEDKEPANGVAP